MDSEIKRLLKLESIKGFNLLDSEKKKLAEWKKAQRRIKPVEPKPVEAPEGHTVMEMGTSDNPTIVANEDLGPVPEVKVVKNIVKEAEKESGKIEE